MATLSKRQFEQQRKQLQEMMKLKAVPFENDTPEKKAARIARGSRDPMFFLKTYFPHYCTERNPDYRNDLFALCNVQKIPQAATAPRGGAKSVICSFADQILNKFWVINLTHFFVIELNPFI